MSDFLPGVLFYITPIYADEKFLVVTKCKNSKTEWREEKSKCLIYCQVFEKYVERLNRSHINVLTTISTSKFTEIN